MSSVPFEEWLAAWLDEVDEGLGVHAGVVLAYGARSVSHLDTFDAGDIKTAADNFRAAGVAPLQCKWIMKSLTDRVAAAKAAAKSTRERQPEKERSLRVVQQRESTLGTKLGGRLQI